MSADAGSNLLDGRYRVLSRLGAGGMGTVWLAEDERLGRRVAVKRLHADSPEETARRFEREARLGAMLNHPNLVAVYDTFSDGEDVLIVMEYVEGPNLATELRGGPMPKDRAFHILHGVAAALDHSHGLGVVHRDVKPANILLGADGVVKLADLGIATAAEQTHITRTGTMLGSPSYMAPEQIEGRRVGPAVDVYALAAVAFEILGGRKARPGGTPLQIAHQVVSDPPPDIRDSWPGAPPAVAAVLSAGLARAAEDRPRSCGEFVQRLEEAVGEADTEATRALPPRAGAAAPATAVADRDEPPAVPARAPDGDPDPTPAHEPLPAWRAGRPRPEPWPGPAADRGPVPPAGVRTHRGSRAPVALAAAGVLLVGGVAAWAAVGGPSGEGDRGPSSAQPTTGGERRTPEPSTTTAPAAPPTEAPTTEEQPATTTTGEAAPSEEPSEPDAARAAALNDRGFALTNEGKAEEAVPVLRDALASFPEGSEDDQNYAYTLYNLAHALRLSGKPEEAVPLLERRLEVSDFRRADVERELKLARAGSTR
jgi:eukaryotic-like serine/threonine-protein kinase